MQEKQNFLLPYILAHTYLWLLVLLLLFSECIFFRQFKNRIDRKAHYALYLLYCQTERKIISFYILKCENYYGDIKNQYKNGFCHIQFENDIKKYTNFNYFQIISSEDINIHSTWMHLRYVFSYRDLHISFFCCFLSSSYIFLCTHLEIESTLYPLITFISSSFLP